MTSGTPDTSEILAATLEREPDVAMNWHRLGVAYAREGAVDALLALCDRAAPRFGNAIKFFHNVAIDLSEQGEWPVFEVLAAGIPAHRLEHPLAVYYQGCERIASGDCSGALPIFQAFKEAVQPRHREYPLADDANFNTVFRQGTLPEQPTETARLLQAAPARTMGDITTHRTAVAANDGFVVAVSADKRYFRRFAAELFQGYTELGFDGPLHFHLIGPDDRCFELFEDLRGRHAGLRVGLSAEPAAAWHNPVYFTCARFGVVGHLLDAYGAAIVMLDADSLPTAHPSAFLAGLDDADFACVKTQRTEPASVYQAGIMVFPNRPKTRTFADDVLRFALAKMDLPPLLAWMLDQAALVSVLTLRGETDPAFRFADLNATAGPVMAAPLDTLAGVDEKSDLMNA